MELCVIDDHPINLSVLKGVIASVPGWAVEGFVDPRLALERARAKVFDLVIVDYQMPGLDGIAFARRLRAVPGFARVPVVMVTADRVREVRLEAIRAGINDFLNKPVDPEELRVRAANLLALRQAQLALEDRAVHLAVEVTEATRLILDREEEMVHRLARAADRAADEPGAHVLRVAGTARAIARAMGLPAGVQDDLHLAAQFHDVGLIGLPDAVLRGARPPSGAEAEDLRRHPDRGAAILADGRTELVRMAHDIALCHHERWDGSGEPRGRVGEAIPLAARIAALACALDDLREAGPDPLGPRARSVAEAGAGTAFDPAAVAAMGRAWPEIERIHTSLPQERLP